MTGSAVAPIFDDGVIRIRPYDERDVRAMFEAARESIAEMHPWMPWCHQDYKLEESADWVHSRADQWALDQEYAFVVEDLATRRLLGGAGLNQFDRANQRANLGYWIRTSAAGRGAATRATRLIAVFGFDYLDLERIEILAAVGNDGSQRVAEKVGASREGILRNRLLLHGQMYDALLYSILRVARPPLVGGGATRAP